MQTKSNYEKSLCRQAGLFSLSKNQADLFLLLQVGTLTYQQLAMTGLHGKTETAGRLSLKRLESSGLVQSREVPNHSQKHYLLTPKGKDFLKDLFPENLFTSLQVDFGRRIPNRNQQILHRIRANDFYLSYISNPYGQPLPWLLEHPLPQLQEAGKEVLLPRCDGLLKSGVCNYYIEQDNSTQSEAVIAKKIMQYLSSATFTKEQLNKNALVFCMAFPKKQPLFKKPSFSLYKTLLKFTKAWKLLEEECGISLDYIQFLQVMETSSLKVTFSENEMQTFEGLRKLHLEMDTLQDITALKKAYLDDTSYFELQLEEMDVLFKKRLKSHFRRLYEVNGDLYRLMLTGLQIYAVPNHRLKLYQPFIMGNECHIGEHILKCLFYSGLNTDSWRYYSLFRLFQKSGLSFWFRQGFLHSSKTAIIVENIEIDLGGKLRINHYLKNHEIPESILFLLVAARENADIYHDEIKELRNMPKNRGIEFCYIDARHSLYGDPPPIYILDAAPDRTPVFLEYDEFDEQIRTLKKEA